MQVYKTKEIYKKILTYLRKYDIINPYSRGGSTQTHWQEGKEMESGMTNDQLNALLETIAKLIEAKAKTVQEAAEIVRNVKT